MNVVPDKNQKDICDAIMNIVRSWKITKDIYSKEHFVDIEREIDKLEITSLQKSALKEHIKDLYHFLKCV